MTPSPKPTFVAIGSVCDGTLALFEIQRGRADDALLAEIAEVVEGVVEPEDRWYGLITQSAVALVRGDFAEAHRHAMASVNPALSNTFAGYEPAGRAAIWCRDRAMIHAVAEGLAAMPFAGLLMAAYARHFQAAADAFDGRTSEAVAGFREARTELRRLEQRATAAPAAVTASGGILRGSIPHAQRAPDGAASLGRLVVRLPVAHGVSKRSDFAVQVRRLAQHVIETADMSPSGDT